MSRLRKLYSNNRTPDITDIRRNKLLNFLNTQKGITELQIRGGIKDNSKIFFAYFLKE